MHNYKFSVCVCVSYFFLYDEGLGILLVPLCLCVCVCKHISESIGCSYTCVGKDYVLCMHISVYADACKITHLNGVYVFPSLENDLWIEQSIKRQKYM